MKALTLVALVFTLVFSNTAMAQRARVANAADAGWEVLGKKRVNWKPERDVLVVGANDGTFRKLKIKVTGGTVYMRRMVVTYGNGTKDEIPLKFVFKRGAESRVIDLRGGKRVIKNIAFIYDRRNTARRARVWVAGKR